MPNSAPNKSTEGSGPQIAAHPTLYKYVVSSQPWIVALLSILQAEIFYFHGQLFNQHTTVILTDFCLSECIGGFWKFRNTGNCAISQSTSPERHLFTSEPDPGDTLDLVNFSWLAFKGWTCVFGREINVVFWKPYHFFFLVPHMDYWIFT